MIEPKVPPHRASQSTKGQICWWWCGLALALSLFGCSSSEPSTAALQPWSHTGSKGVYRIDFSKSWNQETPATFNEHADLAASMSGEIFLIVIPQELPVIDGVPTPDAVALKRASVEIMRSSIESFRIDHEMPTTLGTTAAEAVFASGVVSEIPISYLLTYVTRGKWGYQIVGWAPAYKKSTLATQLDEVLGTWKFPGGDLSEPQDPSRP